MPDFTTPTAADQATAGPARTVGWHTGAVPRIARVRYTLAGTEDDGDTIGIVHLPHGAVPLPELSHVTSSGGVGTALTFKVGTLADDDLLAGTLTLSAASARVRRRFDEGATIGETFGGQSELADTTLVVATVVTATSLNAGVHLDFVIAYAMRP